MEIPGHVFYPNERIALFIDGANLSGTVRALGIDIDFRMMLKFFSDRSQLLRAYYFTAMLGDMEANPIRRLVDWLDYNGFIVVSRPAREFYDQHTGERRIKGDTDVELVVEMLEMAPLIDHAVLFSGDGDFRAVVEAVQRKATRVTVVSTIRTRPPMIADELRRQADFYIDLADLAELMPRKDEGEE